MVAGRGPVDGAAYADPDYAIRPWDVSSLVAAAAGIGSLVLGVAAMVTLLWATRRRVLDPRWWAVLIPLLAAGFGGPVLAALMAWALAGSVYLLARAHHARTRQVHRERQ